MKKIVGALFISLIAICLCFTIIYALYNGKQIKEQYDATSYNKAFTITKVDDQTNSDYYYQEDNLVTSTRIEITNNTDSTKSFDLLFFSNSNCSIKINSSYYKTEMTSLSQYISSQESVECYNDSKVLLSNYQIDGESSVICEINLESASSYKAVVLTNSIYNRYVKNEFEFYMLNNEYKHSASNNDVSIDDINIVYTPVDDVDENNYQSYFLKNKDGDYVVSITNQDVFDKDNNECSSDGSFNSSFQYYSKQIVYKNVYNQNAFKNIFIIDSFMIGSISSKEEFTIPCSIHLLYNNITLNENIKLNNYYSGYFEIDSLGGYFDNVSNSIDLNYPFSYVSLGEGIIKNVESNYSFSCMENGIEPEVILNDASSFIDRILPINASINGQSIFIVTKDLFLPSQYYLADVSIDYEFYDTTINSEGIYEKTTNLSNTIDSNGNIVFENNSVVVCASIKINYQDEVKQIEKYVYIVGKSEQDKLYAYKEELSYLIMKNYNNGTLKPVLILKDDGLISLEAKYFSTACDYTFTKGLKKIDVINEFQNGFILKENSIAGGVEKITISRNQGDTVMAVEILLEFPTKSIQERTNYISKQVNSFVLTSYNMKKSLPGINSDELSPAKPSAIRYELFKLKDGKYTPLNDKQQYYTVTENEDGTSIDIQFLAPLSLDLSERLFLKSSICYNDEEFDSWENPNEHIFYREVILQESGYGGEGKPVYVGLQFELFFNNHPELIYSDEDLSSFSSNLVYFKMEIDYELMNISTEEERNALKNYFELVDNGGSYSTHNYACWLVVKTEAIPVYDTVIYIKCSLSDNSDYVGTESAYIQYYSFTIPGVLHNQSQTTNSNEVEIGDDVLYQYLKNTFTDSYASDDIRNNYLLRREAEKSCNTLDLSYAAIEAFCNENEISLADHPSFDLKGLYYFSNVENIILDNTVINDIKYLIDDDLSDNDDKDNFTIKSLSVKNAQLDNVDLSHFKALNIVHLETNNLTNMPSIYRTVTYIYLQNNKISSLEGIDAYVSVVEMDISNNNIKTFEELKQLTSCSLQRVYLYNNVAKEGESFNHPSYSSLVLYGSLGVVSYPIYQDLLDHNVEVYYDINGDDIIIYSINDYISNESTSEELDQYMRDLVKKEALVALNSIILCYQVTNSITIPVKLKVNNNIIDLQIDLLSTNDQIPTIADTAYDISIPIDTNGKVSIIISINITEYLEGDEEAKPYEYTAYRELYFEVVGN